MKHTQAEVRMVHARYWLAALPTDTPLKQKPTEFFRHALPHQSAPASVRRLQGTFPAACTMCLGFDGQAMTATSRALYQMSERRAMGREERAEASPITAAYGCSGGRGVRRRLLAGLWNQAHERAVARLVRPWGCERT